MLDAHLHLCDDVLYPNASFLIEEARACGVTQFLCIVTNKEELHRALVLKERYSFLKIGASTTPHEALSEHDPFFDLVSKAARSGELAAIGETGLEYFHPGMNRTVQKTYLKRYIELSMACNLPIVIHCREAFLDLFEILTPFKGKLKGMIHCFTGTHEEALQAIELGLFISISGIVTYKNSQTLQHTLAQLPIQKLLIETDSPYLAPLSQRGKQNKPLFIKETYLKIAELKGISFETLQLQIEQNFAQILGRF